MASAAGSPELLVSHFPSETYEWDLWEFFEAAGPVQNVALHFPTAVVRMRGHAAAERALAELDGRPLRGMPVRVRPFRPFKIFVGSVADKCSSGDIRTLFEDFGTVLECDIVRDYAFVHMENEEDGRAAIQNLDGREVKGRSIIVQPSKSHKRSNSDEEEYGAGNNQGGPPSYRRQPPESFGMDYRPQPKTGRPAIYKDPYSTSHGNRSYQHPQAPYAASSRDPFYDNRPNIPPASFLQYYDDEPAFDPQSVGPSSYPHSAHSLSYGIQPAAGPSYGATAGGHVSFHKAQLSDSLLARNRALVDTSGALQPSGTFSSVAGYRNQPSQTVSSLGMSQSETDALDVPYVRIRLSPPRFSNGRRREINAAHKIGRQNAYSESGAAKGRNAADSDAAAPRQPYERMRLSPLRRSHGTSKAAMANKRFSSSYR